MTEQSTLPRAERMQINDNGVTRWIVRPVMVEPKFLNMRSALGATLRKRRTDAGMTLRDLSRIGVSLGYISEVERGSKEPSTEVLATLAKGLGAPLSDILRETADLMEAPQ